LRTKSRSRREPNHPGNSKRLEDGESAGVILLGEADVEDAHGAQLVQIVCLHCRSMSPPLIQDLHLQAWTKIEETRTSFKRIRGFNGLLSSKGPGFVHNVRRRVFASRPTSKRTMLLNELLLAWMLGSTSISSITYISAIDTIIVTLNM
jgi:hypothetical protein